MSSKNWSHGFRPWLAGRGRPSLAAAAVPLPDNYLGEKIRTAVVFSGLPVALAELDDISAPVERTQRGHRGGGCEPASSESTSTAYEVIAAISSPLNS